MLEKRGPDIQGPSDDFGRIGRKVYDKLIAAGINSKDALGQASRNSYNAITNTIDNEIKDIVTMEQKAWKAFDIRNKAKDFARELSGPELKKMAEQQSQNKHGNINGPSFGDFFPSNVSLRTMLKTITKLVGTLRATERNYYLS